MKLKFYSYEWDRERGIPEGIQILGFYIQLRWIEADLKVDNGARLCYGILMGRV